MAVSPYPWFLALAISAWSQAADISVHATRHGDSFEVEAGAEFEADLDQAWEVLTDYDRLAEFIPGMQASRVVSRSGGNVVVDQRGEARLLFFSFPIQVRLAIEEHPHERIVSHVIEGNFKEMHGTYDLQVRGQRVMLRYSGWMTPDFAIPPLIGTLLVRTTVEKRFGAMVDEILRRQHLRRQPASPAGAQGN